MVRAVGGSKPAVGFVKHHDLRVADQRAGDADATAHAARKFGRHFVDGSSAGASAGAVEAQVRALRVRQHLEESIDKCGRTFGRHAPSRRIAARWVGDPKIVMF